MPNPHAAVSRHEVEAGHVGGLRLVDWLTLAEPDAILNEDVCLLELATLESATCFGSKLTSIFGQGWKPPQRNERMSPEKAPS